MPDFSENHAFDQTLIKDIKLGGQLVGQLCEEYIPTINRDKRVIVVYPVIGTKVRYNMGFFIGDDTHKPARVAWNGTETSIIEYSDLNFGNATKLYLRGASITVEPAEGVEVKQGSIEDEYFTGLSYSGSGSGTESNVSYQYPIVKVFNKIWTRMNYNQHFSENYSKSCDILMDGKQISVLNEFYSTNTVAGKNFPQGWHVAESADYLAMNNKLAANGFSLPGLALKNGAVTGFELYFVGFADQYTVTAWGHSTQITDWKSANEAMLVSSDKKLIAYGDNGSVRTDDFKIDKYCIRLVKD